MSTYYLLAGFALIGVIIFGAVIAAMSRYKRCPSNKILVTYGKVGKNKEGANASAVPIHGGATFVWPVIQSYDYLDLTPITVDIRLTDALTLQNIRVDIPSRFTFAISTRKDIMMNAAERLLGESREEIEKLAEDIIFGQFRATIATMNIEDINTDREGFEKNVMDNVETELNKVGLEIINTNFQDIQDNDGYLEALGKKAAAQVTNTAKVEVANENRDGDVGKAKADQEKRVAVSESEAQAVDGENKAKITEANSNSERRQEEAEAESRAVSSEKTQRAAAEKAGYVAEQEAESERKKKEQISQEIEVVVPAQVAKQKAEQEAEAEMIRLAKEGEGRGLAIQKEKEGEAKGIQAILEKKADGLKQIVEAAGGNANHAALLMIVEQLPQIVESQAKAISNIEFGKITVIDSGGNGAGNGASNWLQEISRSMPGIDAMLETAGLNLPEILGSRMENADKSDTEKEKPDKNKEVAVTAPTNNDSEAKSFGDDTDESFDFDDLNE